MNDSKVALPTYDEAFKNYNYRLAIVLLSKLEYTQPCGDNPFQRLDKDIYKRNKKKIVNEYGKSERTWNRDFKKMIELGYIKEGKWNDKECYLIYNKYPTRNDNGNYYGYKTIKANLLRKMIEDGLESKHIKTYLLIYLKTCNDFGNFKKHIPLTYFATTFETNITNAWRDYIGYRPKENDYEYEEGKKVGIISYLEELDYVEIKTERGKCSINDIIQNRYLFKVLLI